MDEASRRPCATAPRSPSIGSTSLPTRSRPTPRSRTAPSPGTAPRWSSVEATAGGKIGLGYTYADAATGRLIRRPAGRGRPGPRRDGRARRPGRRWSQADPQPRPAGHRLDGDLRRRRRPLGPEGPAARPAAGHPPRRGPRRRARLRQRRLHVVFDRAAAGAARRLGRRGHPAGQDEDRHATRPTTSTASAPPARRSGPRPSCSSTPTAPTAASRRWPWPSASPSSA